MRCTSLLLRSCCRQLFDRASAARAATTRRRPYAATLLGYARGCRLVGTRLPATRSSPHGAAAYPRTPPAFPFPRPASRPLVVVARLRSAHVPVAASHPSVSADVWVLHRSYSAGRN